MRRSSHFAISSWAEFVKLLLPMIRKHELESFADLQPETIEQRLRDEVTESGGVIMFPSLIATERQDQARHDRHRAAG
jgi:hypothetical protein